MKHFAMAQILQGTSVCMQSLSLHAQQTPWEQQREREARNPHLKEQNQPLVAQGMDWSFSGGVWRGRRGTGAGCCPGRKQEDRGHCGVRGRQGGREGGHRAGVWAWARRTRASRSGKLLARAALAILRVSVQTKFRNFYFKIDSPLPLPHTQKHTLIHHVEILQTHLFKKIDSISLSARSVIFFFSYASKSPNVDTVQYEQNGKKKKKFLFANTASFAQATSYIFCGLFPNVSFCTLSDWTASAPMH